MSLIPYEMARPFLFGLDPENAHDLTITALANSQRTPLSCLYSNLRIKDSVKLAGLIFPNRVGLAAGLDKNAKCIDALNSIGFGFVEVGTVTPLAQKGNPKPRMFRLEKANALINRLGFNNDGLDAFIKNVKESNLYQQKINPSIHREERMLLGLNIGKNSITPIENATDDYITCLKGVYPYADYITLNISSPNTPNLRDLQTDNGLDNLLRIVSIQREELAQSHGYQTPIFVKIAPDLNKEQVKVIAIALQNHKMDGVIATNTTLSRDKVIGLPYSQEIGGLSGTPVLHMSNEIIRQFRQALGATFPIIGVGGILSPDDALSKIQAGADVVQIYTGLIYKGPELVTHTAQRLKDTNKS